MLMNGKVSNKKTIKSYFTNKERIKIVNYSDISSIEYEFKDIRGSRYISQTVVFLHLIIFY